MTDLEKALITIREECTKHEHCTICPLRLKTETPTNMCYIRQHRPHSYALKCDKETDDRVFAD